MTFLILTRASFEDLDTRGALPRSLLYVNPGVLAPAEISALRAQGADLRVLPEAVDPQASEEVSAAIRLIESESPAPVWVTQESSRSQAGQPTTTPAAGPVTDQTHRVLASHAGRLAAWAFRQIRQRALSDTPLLIIPYLGYGNAHRISLRGRVLLDEGFAQQGPEDSGWRNLVEFYKRLESDEVSEARVRARFAGIEQETVTDRGGYFSFEIVPATPLTTVGWHTVALELVEPSRAGGNAVQTSAEVLIPPATARFGVISDIDDTILWTNVTNRLNMLLMLGRSNAHTRKPFKGVAAFYRALRDGAGGAENNPLFYVSSSPWHLFTPLITFLRLQDIPVGPLMLRELSVRTLLGRHRHQSHKLNAIEKILRLYPHLQFVLIGDSGEKDPEIYAEVVKRHPQAIRAIYIRNVDPDPARIEALDRLIDEVRASGAQLILAPDSEFAAAHAAAEGLIRPANMAQVRADKKADDNKTD
ncbi:MAG: phosphatase domain-containing protein [Pseudomonadota bacterium]